MSEIEMSYEAIDNLKRMYILMLDDLHIVWNLMSDVACGVMNTEQIKSNVVNAKSEIEHLQDVGRQIKEVQKNIENYIYALTKTQQEFEDFNQRTVAKIRMDMPVIPHLNGLIGSTYRTSNLSSNTYSTKADHSDDIISDNILSYNTSDNSDNIISDYVLPVIEYPCAKKTNM